MGQAKVTKGTKGSLLFQKIRIIAGLREENRMLREKIAMLEKRLARIEHVNLLNEKGPN